MSERDLVDRIRQGDGIHQTVDCNSLRLRTGNCDEISHTAQILHISNSRNEGLNKLFYTVIRYNLPVNVSMDAAFSPSRPPRYGWCVRAPIEADSNMRPAAAVRWICSAGGGKEEGRKEGRGRMEEWVREYG